MRRMEWWQFSNEHEGSLAMKSESTYKEVTMRDPMDDCWERVLDERSPFDEMGSWHLGSLDQACAELPF